MRVVAVVPLFVGLVVHFTDVVSAVERSAVVRDSVQLVLLGALFARMG